MINEEILEELKDFFAYYDDDNIIYDDDDDEFEKVQEYIESLAEEEIDE